MTLRVDFVVICDICKAEFNHDGGNVIRSCAIPTPPPTNCYGMDLCDSCKRPIVAAVLNAIAELKKPHIRLAK